MNRLGPPITQFPSYMSLGAAGRTRLARQVAKASGVELREAGFTMVFAPVADVTIGSRDTAIGSRSAGSDPAEVADLVAASTRGFADAGDGAGRQAFPGPRVGSRGQPSRTASAATLARVAAATRLPAVRAGSCGPRSGRHGGTHCRLRCRSRSPGDLSPAVVELLRTRLGFGGVVVSDSLQMKAVTDRYGPARAVVAAVLAGVDVVLMPADPAEARRAIIRAVRQGRLTRDRLEQAVARLGAVMLHQATRSTVGPSSPLVRMASSPTRCRLRRVTVVVGTVPGPLRRSLGPADRAVGIWCSAFSAAARACRSAGWAVRCAAGPRSISDSRIAPGAIAVSVDTPYRMIRLSRSPTQLALFGSTRGLVACARRRTPGRPACSGTPSRGWAR